MRLIKTIVFTAFVTFIAFPTFSQDKDSDLKKVEKKVNVSMKMDGDKIHLKVIKNGEAVLDKTYNSKEELANDPELKEYNVFMGNHGSFKSEDGHINVTIGENGAKKLIFVREYGEKREISDGDHKVWIHKAGEGNTGDGEMFFGASTFVIKDKDGNITIEREGEVVDLLNIDSSESIKVERLGDGTLKITDKNGTREIKMDNMQKGAVFITEDAKFESIDDKVFHMKSKEDGNGNVIIEFEGGAMWVSDNLHESEHNVMFFGESDEHFGEGGEGKRIIFKEIKSGDGNDEVVIVTIERIHLEIVDLVDLKEIEEIPGSNVVSSKMLQLEEVSYYPNPNTGVFNLKFSAEQKPTNIRVIDMTGKEVYAEKLSNFSGRYDQQIDLTGNERGVYILQIIQGAKTWNKKVLIE